MYDEMIKEDIALILEKHFFKIFNRRGSYIKNPDYDPSWYSTRDYYDFTCKSGSKEYKYALQGFFKEAAWCRNLFVFLKLKENERKVATYVTCYPLHSLRQIAEVLGLSTNGVRLLLNRIGKRIIAFYKQMRVLK